MAAETRTSIQVSKEVRNQIRNLKRGHETYEELLTKMADQYEPGGAADDS